MPILAGFVFHNTPPTAWINIVWCGNFVSQQVLASPLMEMHRRYQIAIRSYQYISLYFDFNQWPATIK